jgi:hypothetical protein
LEKVFAPVFTQEDIVNLGRFQFYLSLMIDDVGSRPFSAVGIGPLEKPEISYRTQLFDSSRAQFAKPRAEIEEFINNWHGTHFETNREMKQTQKRIEKFGSKPRFDTSKEEEKPSKIIIPLDIQQTISQEKTQAAEDVPLAVVSKIVIPKLDISRQEEKPVQKQNIQLAPKVFKPKTPPIKKDLPQGVKEFIQSTENPKEEIKHLPNTNLRFSKKEASEENKNALKNALAMALKNAQPKKEDPKLTLPHKPQIPQRLVQKKPEVDHVSLQNLVNEAETILEKYTKQSDDENWNTFDTKIHYEEKASSHKEVPEDVLRSILD